MIHFRGDNPESTEYGEDRKETGLHKGGSIFLFARDPLKRSWHIDSHSIRDRVAPFNAKLCCAHSVGLKNECLAHCLGAGIEDSVWGNGLAKGDHGSIMLTSMYAVLANTGTICYCFCQAVSRICVESGGAVAVLGINATVGPVR